MTQVTHLDVKASENEVMPKQQMDVAQRWLGIFASFTVAWGLLSLVGFVMSLTTSAQTLSHYYTPEQVQYLLNTPFWAGAGKGFNCGGLLIGSVYLLLRKESAYFWFMWSLFGTLLVMTDSILRGGFQILGGMETGVNLASIIVGIFIFWAAYTAVQEGQLQPQ